jgi:signal transduction histidine kinase
MECGDDSLLLTIEDDGRGFDVSTNGHKKGLGLTGLQERARMLGGELMIQSEQGKGTKMVFKFNFSR